MQFLCRIPHQLLISRQTTWSGISSVEIKRLKHLFLLYPSDWEWERILVIVNLWHIRQRRLGLNIRLCTAQELSKKAMAHFGCQLMMNSPQLYKQHVHHFIALCGRLSSVICVCGRCVFNHLCVVHYFRIGAEARDGEDRLWVLHSGATGDGGSGASSLE